jgi:hypothetical protein
MFGEKPPGRTPEYLAALAALQHHADDPRVAAVLAQAQRSRDPEVARAARGGKAGAD